jgi:hypothetical protein
MPGPGASYSSTWWFRHVANYLFSSNAVLTGAGPTIGRGSYTFEGSLANEMVLSVDGPYQEPTFQDPMDRMIDTMREIAFRTAVRANKDGLDSTTRYEQSVIINTKAEQEVEYNGYVRRSIYVTISNIWLSRPSSAFRALLRLHSHSGVGGSWDDKFL